MTGNRLQAFLWLIVALSLIPASLLVWRRVQAEGERITVTLLMDELALTTQAEYEGVTSFELAERYRGLGLNGIALYEETLSTLDAKGDISLLTSSQLRAGALAAGEALPEIPADSVLATELVAGALEQALAKASPKPQKLELDGRSWYVFLGSDTARPAGYRPSEVARWAEAGYDIAYRPRNYPNLDDLNVPEATHYLVYFGQQVAGNPDALSEVVDLSQNYITGIIEGTPQAGMTDIIQKIPTARLLSFNQDYINQRLSPQDLIDKYLLAANERGVRLLYLRPYIEEWQGDMVANTEAMIAGLSARLEDEGYAIGPLGGLELDYQTNALLRGLCGVGVLAGLGLLALMYPGVWGLLVALAVLALGLLAGGLDWAALALVAALTFPVLGFGLLRERLVSLGLATLISLAGAVLLSGVGSDREAMLAITPFAGVAATLIIPPMLFIFHYALRYRRPAAWVRTLWSYPIRTGDVALVLVAATALAVVFLRRGNFPIIGVSESELAIRNWLSDLFVRPRFKELLGHPLAVLGLTNGDWPAWIKGGLLTGGVIAQASILNSFSHYHTPLLISLQRTMIALVLGLIIGLILVPLARFAVRLTKRWLSSERAVAAD